MRYVYLLQSLSCPRRRYVGATAYLATRLREHNSGRVLHTAKHRPWKAVVAIRFADHLRAARFERYLKSGSGHAFANRHFW